MEIIKNKDYEGEYPLFATHDLQLGNITIYAGEFVLKECSNIVVVNCRFEGKYPFWHTNSFIVRSGFFTEGARAAFWYSQSLQIVDTVVEAPKTLRETDGIKLENVQFPNALETFWHCRNVELKKVQINKADYLFMHSENIRINNYSQNGNYSFQYCKNVEIHNVAINSKDAFWNMENVTVYDSELNGEYLEWHSHNLYPINCRILRTQPLCYTHDLVMENCMMADGADLCFEYSSLQATINTPVHSVRNPRTGNITVEGYEEIITDGGIKALTDYALQLRDNLACFNV